MRKTLVKLTKKRPIQFGMRSIVRLCNEPKKELRLKKRLKRTQSTFRKIILNYRRSTIDNKITRKKLHKISVSTVPCTNCASIFIPMKSWSRWVFRCSIEKKIYKWGSDYRIHFSYSAHSVLGCVLFICFAIAEVFVACCFDFLQIVCCTCVVGCFMLNILYIGGSVFVYAHYVYSLPFAVYFCWFLSDVFVV